MQMQWFLCSINKCPHHEEEELKVTDNLSIKHPELFNGGWYVWLPIIPRVGDTLQFAGWQVQVSDVVLNPDWYSKTGIMENTALSASITIRENVVLPLLDSHYAIEGDGRSFSWENFARRGDDTQFFAWELRHEFYMLKRNKENETGFHRWHTRIRPIAGDIVQIKENRWKISSVELTSANSSVDGYLTLEAINLDV
jgi:hypothetical protein